MKPASVHQRQPRVARAFSMAHQHATTDAAAGPWLMRKVE
jgi:hypothetical protein